MSQSAIGEMVFLEDFAGQGIVVADTTAPPIQFGTFLNLVGQGLAETDSGAVRLDSDGLAGVIQLSTTDEDVHAAGFQTATMFAVGKMAPLVLEVRSRQAVIATGEIFIGFSDVNTDLAIIEGAIAHGATTTLTLTASDMVGFLKSADLTDTSLWHAVYNGGSATGVTSSTTAGLGVSSVAGDFKVFRIEIYPSGTVCWYIDGVLLKTVVGAVSTTTNLCVNVLCESKTTAVKTMDIDYILVKANRDWTV